MVSVQQFFSPLETYNDIGYSATTKKSKDNPCISIITHFEPAAALYSLLCWIVEYCNFLQQL